MFNPIAIALMLEPSLHCVLAMLLPGTPAGSTPLFLGLVSIFSRCRLQSRDVSSSTRICGSTSSRRS